MTSGALEWPGLVAAGVLPLVEYRHQYGREVDDVYFHDDTSRSVEVALVVSHIMSRSGTRLPETDARLAAVLARDGVECEPWTRWSLAELPGPRFGVVTHTGVIESDGEHLVLVETLDAHRYTRFWCVPGVRYPVAVGEGAQHVSDW